ncbi:MAG: hypothetical protein LBV67_08450, partial [Streptococcaceae bacterium]|nr:hypothetical protein [Streptococcaceae bacterium]
MKEVKNRINLGITSLFVLISYLYGTYSSPFYQTNPWVDTNAMLTMGRAWLHGMIPFRDIFEQRGPVMYLIYLIAARISQINFLGVFVMEVLFGFISFYLLTKIAQLFVKNQSFAYWVGYGAFLLTIGNVSFRYGGSPEQFALPFILGLLYLILIKMCKDEDYTHKDFFVQGMLLGTVFWLKYSLIGAWVGFFLFIAGYFLIQKKWIELLRVIASAVGGFLAISAPIIIYYSLVNGLKELIQAYFVLNLTTYGNANDNQSKIVQILQGMQRNFTPHVIAINVFVLSLLVFLLHKQIKLKQKVLLTTVFGFQAFFIYYSGHPYSYYFLPMTAFLAIIFIV